MVEAYQIFCLCPIKAMVDLGELQLNQVINRAE